MSALDAESTVAQWVAENPPTATVLEEFEIDYCCGGGISLSEACERKRLDPDAVLSRLSEAAVEARKESTENWLDSELSELCDHIEATHHSYLRKQLPRLTELIDKVACAHEAKHPELRALQQAFRDLRAELEPHMMKEEQILFPAIRQLENIASQPTFPFGSVANPIRMMEHEHDAAGSGLTRIRELTGRYETPEDACNTYIVMLNALQELEADLHRHIHKENFILFPRAQQLESALSEASS